MSVRMCVLVRVLAEHQLYDDLNSAIIFIWTWKWFKSVRYKKKVSPISHHRSLHRTQMHSWTLEPPAVSLRGLSEMWIKMIHAFPGWWIAKHPVWDLQGGGWLFQNQPRKTKQKQKNMSVTEQKRIDTKKCSNECRELKIVRRTCEEATPEWPEKERKGENVPLAAPDSSADELSGVSIQ